MVAGACSNIQLLMRMLTPTPNHTLHAILTQESSMAINEWITAAAARRRGAAAAGAQRRAVRAEA